MAAGNGVTIFKDGGGGLAGNIKMQPYVIALVRWCVSCMWSAAAIVLPRFVTTSLTITSAKQIGYDKGSRAASSSHIHPEPLVQCVVLHSPEGGVEPEVDFIFLHGLYGSLENTWRQGDWRSKYKIEPNKIPLRRAQSIPETCDCEDCKCKAREPYKPTLKNIEECICNKKYNIKTKNDNIKIDNENNNNDTSENDKKCEIELRNDSDIQFQNDSIKIDNDMCLSENTTIYDREMFITEGFYTDSVDYVNNYEMQAQFVKELFNLKRDECDKNCDIDTRFINNQSNESLLICESNYSKENLPNSFNEFINNGNDIFDESYIKIQNDIHINPNGNDIFVESSLKEHNDIYEDNENDIFDKSNIKIHNDICDNDIKIEELNDTIKEKHCEVGCGCICSNCYSNCWPKDWLGEDYPNSRIISVNYTSDPYLWRPLWVKECKRLRLQERAEQMTKQLLNLGVGERPIIWVGHSKGGLFIKQIYAEAYESYLLIQSSNNKLENDINIENNQNNSTLIENQMKMAENSLEVNFESTVKRARLWSASAGFMFYSVPHRGSPLADIKTPITARSIELLEISKDCSLVLTLQDRWLAATEPLQPVVRSLVETNRTLMAVLWLRIVSVESADAGIGALCGVSVDHREICKPSSRSCVLYTELIKLIHASINRWRDIK